MSVLLTLRPVDVAAGMTMALLDVEAKGGEVRLVLTEYYDGNRTSTKRIIPLEPAKALQIAANLGVSAVNAANGFNTGDPTSIARLTY
jgi:hypothetical protein